MGENMTAFHWLLGWWFLVTIVSGAMIAYDMARKDVARWRAQQSRR